MNGFVKDLLILAQHSMPNTDHRKTLGYIPALIAQVLRIPNSRYSYPIQYRVVSVSVFAPAVRFRATVFDGKPKQIFPLEMEPMERLEPSDLVERTIAFICENTSQVHFY